MRKLLLLFLLLALGAPCFASDIYFGPTSAGSNNGTNCSNAYAYNDAKNGINGTGTASWVAGNTLHLCGGTWPGSAGQVWVSQPNGHNGTSGNPITIKFEAGAILSAPYHNVTGAIQISGNYIIVDGGASGVVQNTANGTSGSPNCINGPCSLQQASVFVRIYSGSNIEVKNLTLSDVYVNDSNTNNNDTSGYTTYCVYSLGNSNVTVDHNICHDADVGFTMWGTNAVISHNTAYNTAWEVGSGIIAPVSGLQVDNNSFTKNCNWYTTSDLYHLNNIHLFPNGGTANYGGVVIYNNYLAGGCLLGAQTAHLFLEGTFTSPQIFNNLFDNQNGASPYFFPSIELLTGTGGGGWTISNPLVVNNTFIGGSYTATGSTDFQYDTGVTGLTFQNNVVTGGKTMLALAISRGGGAGNFASNGVNNNAYDATNNGGSGNPFSYNGTAYRTFALYRAALPIGSGQESFSIIDPLATLAINSDGTLEAGSPAIGLGTNLTSLGITGLNTGAPQTFGASGSCGTGCQGRPPSGAWDAGAYQFTGRPNPPQNLTTIVQ